MTESKSTSRQGSAQKWAKPLAINAANETQGVYDDAAPGLQNITGQVQGMLPGILAKFQAGNPALNSATSYASNVLSPDFLSGKNPYLDSIINTTNGDVTDQVGAAFGSRGSFGGTAHTTALGKALSANESGLRYGDYSSRVGQQQSAMQSAPQLAASEYLGINPFLAAAQTGASLPYTGISALDSNLASLFQGGKSTQTGGTLGPIMQGLGAAASVAAKASDPRLKENIEKVGEFSDGLGIYRWNYIWDGPETRHEGVMADEVAELRPWALGPEIAGYATVVYGAL